MTAAEITRSEALLALLLSPFVLTVLVLVTLGLAYVSRSEARSQQAAAARYWEAIGHDERAQRAEERYRLSADTEARRVELRRRAWGADE